MRMRVSGMSTEDGLFMFLPTLGEQNYTILVRDCAVDSGGVNSESEIGRESHCWMVRRIKYEDQYGPKYMSGCSLACDTDGCNHSNSIQASYWLLVPFLGYSLATRITSSVWTCRNLDATLNPYLHLNETMIFRPKTTVLISLTFYYSWILTIQHPTSW